MVPKQMKKNEVTLNAQQLIQTWYIIGNPLPEEKRTFKDIEVNLRCLTGSPRSSHISRASKDLRS
jgi:hypothetical protein